jgi:tRNA-intron endonuclease
MKAKIIANGVLIGGNVLVSNEKEANSLYQKGFYGDMKSGGKLTLALVEAIYLAEKGKLIVKKGKTAKKELSIADLLKLGEKIDAQIYPQYVAYTDLRDKGYLVKTGFKFGAHFRIYNRGEIPGQAHSEAMVHAVPEYYNLTMTELSRIIRLGHSVKKSMWLAVVDNENDVTYYKTGRITP